MQNTIYRKLRQHKDPFSGSFLFWGALKGLEEAMQSTAEIPALFNLEDAARSLGRISSWTLRRHLRRGTLSAVRIGRRLL